MKEMKETKEIGNWYFFTLLGTFIVAGVLISLFVATGTPSPKPDAPPEHLTINGRVWDIKKAGMLNPSVFSYLTIKGADAATSCDSKTIYYIPGPNDRTILFHEVFHAGACDFGGHSYWNSDSNSEIVHPGIYHLAAFMDELERSDKEFLQWEASGY